ncbi:hypothetical protein ACH4S9_44545 [Streptomyces sp. NPDC021225]|uniref:hypothetical protein n=1 Tax=Streptomyces sp. NPDC021225 TaxID=3365121 RepID=UPI0037879154
MWCGLIRPVRRTYPPCCPGLARLPAAAVSRAQPARLLITQKTAASLGPAGMPWTTRVTRNLTATLERLRADRQPEEALAPVTGIDETSAISYSASARHACFRMVLRNSHHSETRSL